MNGNPDRQGINPQPLLAGSSLAGALVWWPLLSVLYLIVAPGSDPAEVALVGGGLLVLGLVRAAARRRGEAQRPVRGGCGQPSVGSLRT